LQLWLQVSLLGFLGNYPTPGGFGTPLSYLEPIRSAILSQHPQNVLASLDGQYIGYHDETTVWNFLLYDVPSVRFLTDKIDVYPADSALTLSHNCVTNGQNFQLRPPNEGCYTIGERSPQDFDHLGYVPLPDANQGRFANGAQVFSYKWDSVTGCVSLVFSVSGPRPEDFQVAVHFLNAADQQLFQANGTKLQADGETWRGRYWSAGDRIVQRFCLQSSLDQVRDIGGVRVGMYTYEDTPQGRVFHNSNLLDTSGGMVDQMMTIHFK
jgi:hypothetical protein